MLISKHRSSPSTLVKCRSCENTIPMFWSLEDLEKRCCLISNSIVVSIATPNIATISALPSESSDTEQHVRRGSLRLGEGTYCTTETGRRSRTKL